MPLWGILIFGSFKETAPLVKMRTRSDIILNMMMFAQKYSVHEQAGETTYDLNFTNKELDRDLGLNYFGARYYHPELPRFLSVDPVGGKPTIPISWNRYLYCRNDPINRIDPDGRIGILAYCARIAASSIMGALTGGLAASFDNNGKSIKHNIAAGVIAGLPGGFVGGVAPPGLDTPLNVLVSATIYNGLQGNDIMNPDWDGSAIEGIEATLNGDAEITDVFTTPFAASVGTGIVVGGTVDAFMGFGDELIGNPAGSVLSTFLVILATGYAEAADDIAETETTVQTTDEMIGDFSNGW